MQNAVVKPVFAEQRGGERKLVNTNHFVHDVHAVHSWVNKLFAGLSRAKFLFSLSFIIIIIINVHCSLIFQNYTSGKIFPLHCQDNLLSNLAGRSAFSQVVYFKFLSEQYTTNPAKSRVAWFCAVHTTVNKAEQSEQSSEQNPPKSLHCQTKYCPTVFPRVHYTKSRIVQFYPPNLQTSLYIHIERSGTTKRTHPRVLT